MLGNVLIRATKSAVVLSATDMMVSITETLPCDVAIQGSVGVWASHLHSMVRVLGNSDVLVRALDGAWVQIKEGRTEYKVQGVTAGDFPDLPDPDGVSFTEVKAPVLTSLIDKTLFSVCADEAKVNLNGALLESDGKTATMVSTDGHRLTKYSVALDLPELAGGVVIPRKGLAEIRRLVGHLDGACSLGVGRGQVFVRAGDVLVAVKLCGVTFPPWRQVLPKGHQSTARVSRSELLDALRQAVVVAPNKTLSTKITVEPKRLRLAADSPDLGSVNLEVPAEWSNAKGSIAVGVNGNYVSEALSAIEADQVELRLNGPLDAVAIVPAEADDDGLLAVVMPMSI